MDMAMVLGGAVIAMLQGMDSDGKQRSIEVPAQTCEPGIMQPG